MNKTSRREAGPGAQAVGRSKAGKGREEGRPSRWGCSRWFMAKAINTARKKTQGVGVLSRGSPEAGCPGLLGESSMEGVLGRVRGCA